MLSDSAAVEKEQVVRTAALEMIYHDDGVETPALRGIDLLIRRGEFVAVAGPSGSGKSTLLHIIGGLLRPTGGEAWVNGRSLNRLSPDELAELRLCEVGFVFQAYNLIPVLTALENAEFVMELQGVPPRRRKEQALSLLRALKVEELAGRRPDQLSGGQRQRVAVARAVAPGPSLVLADEPTANLDSETSLKLIELMRRLNEEQGVTFLFATHDTRLLERVKRVIYLEDGRISRDGEGPKYEPEPL
jgi:putative ABC transport system ATP-binding protein